MLVAGNASYGAGTLSDWISGCGPNATTRHKWRKYVTPARISSASFTAASAYFASFILVFYKLIHTYGFAKPVATRKT